eukprot:7012369-Prymnesium_polylepis.1
MQQHSIGVGGCVGELLGHNNCAPVAVDADLDVVRVPRARAIVDVVRSRLAQLAHDGRVGLPGARVELDGDDARPALRTPVVACRAVRANRPEDHANVAAVHHLARELEVVVDKLGVETDILRAHQVVDGAVLALEVGVAAVSERKVRVALGHQGWRERWREWRWGGWR